MGDPNAGQVELTCPGCQTTFHLRPRKSRMPRNPIPCPKCGTAIEMTKEQVNQLRSIVGATTPTAQVLKRRSSKPGSETGPSDSDLDEIERLAAALEDDASKRPSGTLMGHPIAIENRNFDRDSTDHKTRESNEAERRHVDDLGNPKTSEIPKEEVERARASMQDGDATSDHGAKIHFSSFGSEAESDDDNDAETAESERDVHNATTVRPPGMPPAHAPLSEVTEDSRATVDKPTKSARKVPLSELLKKVRSKRTTEGLEVPRLSKPSEIPEPEESGASETLSPSTDEVFDDIVDDVVGSATERLDPVRETAKLPTPTSGIAEPSSTGRSENSMLARLKKIPRSGLREKPGMAGERRGSGFIRLPESEILDMLGDGNYRLRVEEIVYEPIDEDSIVELITIGKLKGSDEIARADGDWRRLAKHPLYLKYGEPQVPAAPEARTGSGTKRMFPALDNPTAPPGPPPRKDQDDQPPAGLQEKSSSTSGEWIRSDLDSTLDSLDAAEDGPNTPPPAEPIAAERAIEQDDDVANDVAPEPVFPEEEEPYQLDGPPSYPAIELPEASEVEAPSMSQEIARDAAADSPAAGAKKSGSILPLIGGFVILAGIVGGAGVLYMNGALDQLISRTQNNDTVTQTPTSPQTTVEAETTPEPAPAPEPTREEKIAAAIESGEWSTALPLLEAAWSEEPTAERGLERARALLETGSPRAARMAIRETRNLEGADAEALDTLWTESLQKQASAPRPVITIDSDWSDFERLPSDAPLFRVVDPEGVAWRFIPNQPGEVTWRAEVAFYELCGVVDCAFDVPKTVEASISSDALASLTDGAAPSSITMEDGVARGALRQAVEEEHVGWPIEDKSIWLGLLDADSSLDELEEPLSDALAGIDEETRRKLVDAAGDASTRSIARQTATILAADYLVNNFARFAPRRSEWGTTVRLANGDLVSVSNRAAFQPRTSTRVRGRFSWTSRFSEDFVDSVRELDRETVDPILFPDATAAERARLDVFWEQRERLLERVDELVKRKSKEAVLPF